MCTVTYYYVRHVCHDSIMCHDRVHGGRRKGRVRERKKQTNVP